MNFYKVYSVDGAYHGVFKANTYDKAVEKCLIELHEKHGLSIEDSRHNFYADMIKLDELKKIISEKVDQIYDLVDDIYEIVDDISENDFLESIYNKVDDVRNAINCIGGYGGYIDRNVVDGVSTFKKILDELKEVEHEAV